MESWPLIGYFQSQILKALDRCRAHPKRSTKLGLQTMTSEPLFSGCARVNMDHQNRGFKLWLLSLNIGCARGSKRVSWERGKTQIWGFKNSRFSNVRAPKYLFLIEEYLGFEAVNVWGFWGPTTSRGDKKNKINIIPSIFMKFWSRHNLDQLDWLTP